jgi:hypothetical protein
VAFVLVIWIGRRYAEMELIEDALLQQKLKMQLDRLDSSWPMAMVLFSSVAIALAWNTIPPGM